MFLWYRGTVLVRALISRRRYLHEAYCSRRLYSSGAFPEWDRLLQTDLYRGLIPIRKLEITCDRSTGPGGQNVNKSNTRVQVRFRIDQCDWIKADVKERLLVMQKPRITSDGYFVLRSERTRSQSLNLDDCLEKLRRSIRECENQLALEAANRPSEEDLQLARRKQEEAERRRIRAKRSRSEKKREKRVDLL